jgi:hypothetical protein
MRKTFLRTLLIIGAVQFVITRHLAGQAIEEGRAERMWMMYPLNVTMNALAWTLVITATARVFRGLRRPT